MSTLQYLILRGDDPKMNYFERNILFGYLKAQTIKAKRLNSHHKINKNHDNRLPRSTMEAKKAIDVNSVNFMKANEPKAKLCPNV